MTEFEQAMRLQRTVDQDDGTPGDQYFRLLIQILERQDDIFDKIDGLDNRVAEGATTLATHIGKEEAVIAGLADAFPKKPDGSADITGHRDYHQELIEEARERKTMWRELRTELVKKGTWGIVLVLGALVAYFWNHEVKR